MEPGSPLYPTPDELARADDLTTPSVAIDDWIKQLKAESATVRETDAERKKTMAKPRRKSRNKSAIVIAELLNTEGFTDHTANVAAKHALKTCTEGQRRRWARTRKMFREMSSAKLDDRDKMILGKFVAAKLSMAFNVGLRIGLTAYMNLSPDDKETFFQGVVKALGEEAGLCPGS